MLSVPPSDVLLRVIFRNCISFESLQNMSWKAEGRRNSARILQFVTDSPKRLFKLLVIRTVCCRVQTHERAGLKPSLTSGKHKWYHKDKHRISVANNILKPGMLTFNIRMWGEVSPKSRTWHQMSC